MKIDLKMWAKFSLIQGSNYMTIVFIVLIYLALYVISDLKMTRKMYVLPTWRPYIAHRIHFCIKLWYSLLHYSVETV